MITIPSTESEYPKQVENVPDESRFVTESGTKDEENVNEVPSDECPDDQDIHQSSTEEPSDEKPDECEEVPLAPEPKQESEKIENLIRQKAEEFDLKLQEMILERKALAEKLAHSEERFYQLTQSVQEDRYRKDKSRLLGACIDEANLIRSSLYDFRKRRDNGELKKNAEEELEEMLEKIVDHFDKRILRIERVEVLPKAEPGSGFREDIQDVVDYQPTDDPQMVGKVACSESPAYVWTLPYILKAKVDGDGNEINSYRFLLEREKVIIYKNQN
ncbi:MAG: hypothetical protein J6T13_00745 [Bacteroidales bacterium]|nr:hypothetical protein [Bacteroidales bacterium]